MRASSLAHPILSYCPLSAQSPPEGRQRAVGMQEQDPFCALASEIMIKTGYHVKEKQYDCVVKTVPTNR